MQISAKYSSINQALLEHASHRPEAMALYHAEASLTYQQLAQAVQQTAAGLLQLGLKSSDHVAIYNSKHLKTVISILACWQAGLVAIPINPQLKVQQVEYILDNSQSKLLISSKTRLLGLQNSMLRRPEVQQLCLDDETAWQNLQQHGVIVEPFTQSFTQQPNQSQLATLLYTSGSTGMPKGVMISDANLLHGAVSVCDYLAINEQDRLLAVLPLSFDYGLSQITCALYQGASAILLDYLLPQDVMKTVLKYQATGLAAVPPLWIELLEKNWPEGVENCLRFITNSGGHLPNSVADELQARLPETQIFLMYGLTEAFRSTYLPPELRAKYPGAMGQAIANAKVFVVNQQGEPCQAGETGELIHCGPHVTLGYWQDQVQTQAKFRPAPKWTGEQLAVWSGDQVYQNQAGIFYFVGRQDDLIKSRGLRVSAIEIEQQLSQCELVAETVITAAPHAKWGQGIIALVRVKPSSLSESELTIQLKKYCQKTLAAYIQPAIIQVCDTIPRNANGKVDRALLKQQYANVFTD